MSLKFSVGSLFQAIRETEEDPPQSPPLASACHTHTHTQERWNANLAMQTTCDHCQLQSLCPQSYDLGRGTRATPIPTISLIPTAPPSPTVFALSWSSVDLTFIYGISPRCLDHLGLSILPKKLNTISESVRCAPVVLCVELICSIWKYEIQGWGRGDLCAMP